MILPLTPVRFKRHAARIFGAKKGIVCGHSRFTYREFTERADRLSDALVRLGLKAGDRVAYLSFNCHRLLEAYFGVPQISAILLPLNIRLSAEELAYILGDSEPRLLFFDPELIPLVESLRQRASSVEHFIALRWHTDPARPPWAYPQTYDEQLAAAGPREVDYRAIDENSVAELFYTSGTTAHPKGVMLTHRNLYLHALYAALALRCADDEVALYSVPLFHVNSWGIPHMVTLTGGRHVLMKKFDPAVALELVQRERVTRLQMVPTMVIALINHPDFHRYDRASVKAAMMGGAPTNTALIRQVEQKIPGCVAIGGLRLNGDVARDYPRRHQGTSGRRTAGDPIAAEGYGRLRFRRVRGAGCGCPRPRREARRPADRGGAGARRRGHERVLAPARRDSASDPVRLVLHRGFGDDRPTGYILIVDRLKDMVLSGGEKIATAEIERVLYEHPSVLECAVIAVPDDTWGEVPKALVVLRPGHTSREPELLDHCRRYLAGFKVPKSVEFVESLPKGGTGKILKKVLREKYWAGKERRVQ